MFLSQENLAVEECVHRLVWAYGESLPPIKAEKHDTPGFDLNKDEFREQPEKKDSPEGLEKSDTLAEARKQKAKKRERTEALSRNKDGNTVDNKILPELKKAYEAQDIAPELRKMTRTQIRNLERENPELLLQTCFWKIEGEDQITPIQNSSEIKLGDKIRFDIPEAEDKNKNLEMGVGLRVLPRDVKVVEIGGEKFFRISKGGAFVDAQGNYRAVRSQARETISLVEANAEDQKTIENLRKTQGTKYARRDLGFAWNAWRESGNASDAESFDAFTAKIESDKSIDPKMHDELSSFIETQKKFEKLWAGFDIEKYKSEIASIESRGGGNYSADNHGRGASDTWNKRAIGRYQFTIETLRDLGVPITSEADIADFKKNVAIQEDVMNHFTNDHLAMARNNPGALEKITSGKYTISDALAVMHLGGAGALHRIETDDLDAKDYMGTSYAEYLKRMHG